MALIVTRLVMAVTMETVTHLAYVIKDVIRDLPETDVTVSLMIFQYSLFVQYVYI